MTQDRRPDRQAAARRALEAEGLDALLVTHLPNIRYLTGFTGTSALLLITPERTVFISDFRYESQAEQEVGASAAVEIDRASVWDRLARTVAAAGVGTLGLEAQSLTLHDAERVAAMPRMRVQSTSGIIERLRVIKDPDEVDAIRRAAALAAAALDQVLPSVRPGETELAVAARLEAALRERGSEWHPFQTIVASGPRSALPHARTSTRTIERGDWLLLDFGAQVDGYCADLTRTIVAGARADARQRAVYETVRAAQQRALSGVQAGMTGREADALARDLIAARGFGDAFGHSLGHGLGLEVHEAPRLAATATDPLPAHAVVTVEPGVYLPGWGGVRLEDDVYLSPDGPVCLSDNRTDLIELMRE
ncbi:MAG TPA: aminopeptidase P family protein [Gemmatimonadales bacterium]|nr:aminopeptidase P family protein [Gemmatimonadales bacterium]